MNRIFNAKPLLAAAIAIGALAAATAAQARSDVVLSIGLNAPYGYAQPAPVYSQPQVVYTQPQPVYYEQAPVYYEQPPVYYQPQPVYYVNRHHREHERRGNWGGWGDADHDGVPNRFDRAPYNPYRR
ncbi:hypothetical protein ACFPOE_22275 [Caenimonas terrae]|uniref:Virulence factor n=1 Tax=Caenimonas terrae TaxID=696074 RepID=A0ABW0NIN4_9BURK